MKRFIIPFFTFAFSFALLSASAVTATKEYVDRQDAANLQAAKDYTDQKVAESAPGNYAVVSNKAMTALDTFHSYNEEQPEYGSSLRWLDGYAGLAFGYYNDLSGLFYPQIRISDTPYGEIRHVGHVDPSRPWSWITIGDSTDENTLQDALDAKADKADISATNPTFSNAVLAVGLNIDTNSVAVLNEIAETFGGFPLEGTATTVGGLLAALAAAIAWLKKNKVGSFDSVGGASATVDNSVAKLDDFFTESNSLLTGTIDARLPYPITAVPSTGLLKDRTINTTSLAFVTVPDNFTDLLIRASVSSSLSVTMPAETTKYGDTFPGEAGEYLITITKTGAAEAYVRTIKLEEVA